MDRHLKKTSYSELWRTISQDRIRLFRTINLYLCFFVLGSCMSILGPTQPMLERNVNTTSSVMGYVVATRFLGCCLGSLLGGYVFARFHRFTILAVAMFLAALTCIAIPFQKEVVLLFIVIFLNGIVLGGVDPGGNVLCLDLWTENPAPFYQALHFHYGIGSVVGPLIAEPFLRDAEDDAADTGGGISNDTFWNITTTPLTPKVEGNIVGPFCILAALAVAVSVSCVVSIMIDRTEIRSNTDKVRVTNQVQGKLLPRCLVGFGMVFLSIYVSMENTYAQFLTTFIMKSKLKMSNSQGSFMTSVFWGSYCFIRGCSIFVAAKVKLRYMLFFNLTIITVTGIVLAIWGESNPLFMWIGSGILGIGAASTWPSSMAWLETYVAITNAIGSYIIVAGAITGFLFSLSVGYIMDYNPSLYLFMVPFCCIIFNSAFGAQLKIVSLINTKRGQDMSTITKSGSSQNLHTM